MVRFHLTIMFFVHPWVVNFYCTNIHLSHIMNRQQLSPPNPYQTRPARQQPRPPFKTVSQGHVRRVLWQLLEVAVYVRTLLVCYYVSLLLISEMCPGWFLSCDNFCLYTLMMNLGVICFRVMLEKGRLFSQLILSHVLDKGIVFLLFTETSLGDWLFTHLGSFS